MAFRQIVQAYKYLTMKRSLSTCFSLMLFLPLLSNTARAESTDAEIYRSVIDVILKHEKPQKFAVWDHEINAETINTPRVPRHDPYKQFSRSLPGLKPALELALLAPEGEAGSGKPLSKFAMPASTATFSGFADRSTLKQSEATAKPDDFNSWLLAVGFSKVAYGDNGKSALIYAESCLTGPDGACNGEGFWLERTPSGWRLKRHTPLWGGGYPPFWQLAHRVTDKPGDGQ